MTYFTNWALVVVVCCVSCTQIRNHRWFAFHPWCQGQRYKGLLCCPRKESKIVHTRKVVDLCIQRRISSTYDHPTNLVFVIKRHPLCVLFQDFTRPDAHQILRGRQAIFFANCCDFARSLELCFTRQLFFFNLPLFEGHCCEAAMISACKSASTWSNSTFSFSLPPFVTISSWRQSIL